MTRKGFRDFVLYLDTFIVKEFQSKWPLDKETYLCQPKTIEDYEKNNIEAKNIILEDTIRPQRQRIVLGLEGMDEEYLMNVWRK